ncbi:MAG TPA: DNA-processing protein DprA [Planktothrix sp.]|jgi:DNA processing protein
MMSFLSEPELWSDEEQAYWLAFDRLPGTGIGVSKLKQVFERDHTIKSLWCANADELAKYKIFTAQMIESWLEKRSQIDPESVLNDLKKTDIQAYPFFHPRYPYRLREIHDPPAVLYMLGELTPDDLRHATAVVGTRKPTSYGERLVKQMTENLALSGVGIVSGMAIGIDSLAHWAAIEGGGKTVAVLACGVDVCYPSSNKPLYQKLVGGEHGAVISEFPPGTKPEEWRFPARNRIVSGLSDAVLVIEAGEKSGALITASIAFEQNRTVFAVPGRVDNPQSKGCHMLIRDGKAHLCEGFLDLMRTMEWISAGPVRGVPTVVELFGRERELYELISSEPVHFDYLCEKSGMPAPELSATLTMLELAGVVTRHPGDWYARSY